MPPKTTIRASPQRAGQQHSAAANERDHQDLPSRSPPATGSSDPGQARSNRRSPPPNIGECNPPTNGARTKSAESPGEPDQERRKSPRFGVNATRPGGGRSEGGRRCGVEDGPPQRVAMAMPPQRVPAAWETEGGGARSKQQRRQRLETFLEKTEPRERVC
mmetsp:Transcript_5326/g.11552  ORF Transcript_5326/g.11552 Transcript_5326/m.11552 type:complete len:161 (+) Transcript_5326:498-980(+)